MVVGVGVVGVSASVCVYQGAGAAFWPCSSAACRQSAGAVSSKEVRPVRLAV